ncbi:hypothetical protein EXIGLDRAFT_229988 [Exidia glandulosa HHB12029]|uniref:Uncharacterized protein n=1 Tax=Exidia glandulosa HHB12029 TaxID=1314781 RepID=A0A165E6Q2_EXIGL|nr:hypothetical protein EXIGLDRAFT_229988 [Exidia glandulosa HHB12029]
MLQQDLQRLSNLIRDVEDIHLPDLDNDSLIRAAIALQRATDDAKLCVEQGSEKIRATWSPLTVDIAPTLAELERSRSRMLDLLEKPAEPRIVYVAAQTSPTDPTATRAHMRALLWIVLFF